jgi:ankyrin repeat protein
MELWVMIRRLLSILSVAAVFFALVLSATTLPARALTQAELTGGLEKALAANDLQTAELLLSQGANPNACWLGCTRTLVDQVLDARNPAALKLLIKHGAKINLVPTPDGTEPSWHALIPAFEAMQPYHSDLLMRVNDPTVIAFIAYGGNVNARNAAGNTWLMELLPTGRGATDLPNILAVNVAHGLDLNAVNNAGETAIIRYANLSYCSADNAKVVALLVSRGANPNVRDKTGHTAHDYALMAACPAMISALSKH